MFVHLSTLTQKEFDTILYPKIFIEPLNQRWLSEANFFEGTKHFDGSHKFFAPNPIYLSYFFGLRFLFPFTYDELL